LSTPLPRPSDGRRGRHHRSYHRRGSPEQIHAAWDWSWRTWLCYSRFGMWRLHRPCAARGSCVLSSSW